MHFAFSFPLLVPQSSHVHSSDDALGGGARPAEAQLKPPVTGFRAGADTEAEEGRGSSHAMHFTLSSGDLVPHVEQVQMSADALGGGMSPAEAQLKPPVTVAGAEWGGADADLGLGSSHAMHFSFARGDLVPQVEHVQMSAEGFGGGARPADDQLKPAGVGGGGGGARRSNLGREEDGSLVTSLIALDSSAEVGSGLVMEVKTKVKLGRRTALVSSAKALGLKSGEENEDLSVSFDSASGEGREAIFVNEKDETTAVSKANEGTLPKSFSGIFSLASALDLKRARVALAGEVEFSSISESESVVFLACEPLKMGPPNASWAKMTGGELVADIHEGGASSATLRLVEETDVGVAEVLAGGAGEADDEGRRDGVEGDALKESPFEFDEDAFCFFDVGVGL